MRYFLRDYDPQKCPVGRGMVDRVPDWRAHMNWADIAILGGNDYCMAEFDAWRARGKPIIGGSAESARWERERLYGMQIMRKAGIEVPPSKQVSTYEEAMAHVEKTGVAYACKPCWDETDKSLSYVAPSPESLWHKLSEWRRKHGRPKGPMLLQEKIAGIEFAVGTWFGPDGFAGGWEENFEHKKLYAGDLGPNCGETGTVIRYVTRSKLADKLLKPLEEQLARIGYVGCVDVNAIVDEDGMPWPLEFTMRFGWPAWNISTALLRDDPIEFFMNLWRGRTENPFEFDTISLGVVLAINDWPTSKMPREESVGVPIYGLSEGLMTDFHPTEVAMGEAPQMIDGHIVRKPSLVTAGDYIAVMTGLGDTVQEARRACYRRVQRLEMPTSPWYRHDIGASLARALPRLQEHGYATGMAYA